MEVAVAMPGGDSSNDATLPPRQEQAVPATFDEDAVTLPPVQSSDPADEFATVIPINQDNDATLAPAKDATNLTSAASAGSRVRYFGDYELLSEIARGGMGVVYKARQVNLNRVVALKMILSGNFASNEEVQRFRTEAEAAANLDHPGIVPIYEIGLHEGQHFFSMGYVDGCSLADRVRNGPLPPKEAAELTKKIAEAIAFAHSRNVIHRDLKPANVLLDQNREPKVTDFGLARKTDTDSGMTRTGAVMGTPSYMPPEQAAGKTNEVGPLSDVYSLGAILYCLLTGRPPLQAANAIDTLKQVMEKEPVSVSTLNPEIQRDLETICHKALQKEPKKRYESAKALADDLGRWQRGEPITARAVSTAERAWRWVKRNQRLSILAAITILAVLAGSAASTVFGIMATVSKVQAVSNLARANFLIGVSRWEDGRIRDARENLMKVPEEHREFEWHLLMALLDRSLLTLHNHSSGVECVAISDDGKLVATGGMDNVIHVIDTGTGKPKFSCVGHEDEINALDFHPNGMLLVSASSDQTVSIWSLIDGTRQAVLQGHANDVEDVEFSVDGSRIASCCYDGLVHFWTVPDGKQIATILKHEEAVFDVSFSPDGQRVATACGEGNVTVWNVETGQKVWSTRLDPYATVVLRYSPEGRSIAVAGASGRIWLVAADSGQLQFDLPGHSQYVNDLCFSPDGRLLASSGNDSTIRLWEMKTRQLVSELGGHELEVTGVAFSPDGSRLFSGGADHLVKLWDTTLVFDQLLQQTDSAVSTLAVSPNSPHFLKGFIDGRLELWDVSEQQIKSSFVGPNVPLTAVCFSPSGRLIAAASEDASIRIFDVETRLQIAALKGHTSRIQDVAFSQDGRQVVSGSDDGTIRLWDVENGFELRVYKNGSDAVQCTSFAKDGEQIVSGDTSGNIKFWDSKSGRQLRSFKGHGNTVMDLMYSPDGNTLATADADGSVRLWQSSAGNLRTEIKCPGMVFAVRWSNDGARLLTSGDDEKVRIWDALPGEELLTLSNSEPQYHCLNFLFPGHRVILATNGELPTTNGLLEMSFSTPAVVPPVDEWHRILDLRLEWHLQQAEALEKSKDWFPASFHRAWRLARQPMDATELQQLRTDVQQLQSDIPTKQTHLPKHIQEVLMMH
jgi:WD40 repeat protein/tRNA A-37 threonylcarbamoyl transferase component Bud32